MSSTHTAAPFNSALTNTKTSGYRRSESSKALLDEPPAIIQPRLEQILGEGEARLVQQIHYWLQRVEKEWIDERTGLKMVVKWFKGRKYINIPPGFFLNRWRGWCRTWGQTRFKAALRSSREQSALLVEKFNGTANNGYWYAVHYEAIDAMDSIQRLFEAQVDREAEEVRSDPNSRDLRLSDSRQDEIFEFCQAALKAAQKECDRRIKAEPPLPVAFDPDGDFFLGLVDLRPTEGQEEATKSRSSSLLVANDQKEVRETPATQSLNDQPHSQETPGGRSENDLPLLIERKQHKNETEHQQEHRASATFSAPQSDVVVVVDSSNFEQQASPENSEFGWSAEEREQRYAIQRLLEKNEVSPGVAKELAATRPLDVLRLQLDCINDRPDLRNKGGTLAKAIREEWAPPGTYLDRQKDAGRAENARLAQMERQAAETRQKAVQDAENERLQAHRARLDAIWEGLDDEDRALVRETALKRNTDAAAFVLDRVRRGSDIPLPLRQDAVEHLLVEGLLLEPEAVAAPGPVGVQSETDSLDALWNASSPLTRERIEGEARNRLAALPEAARSGGAFLAMRRNLLREMWEKMGQQEQSQARGEDGPQAQQSERKAG